MKIAIVGSEGVVGSALKFGFELIGHEVKCHDLKLKTKLDDVLDTELLFICVPTPSNADGSCDTSIVEGIIEKLSQKYSEIKDWNKKRHLSTRFPVVCIKSTCPIGTTKKFQKEYCLPDLDGYHMKLAFCPEFLRERSATIDFTERQDLLVIGTDDNKVFELIKKAHGKLPKKVVQVSPNEAEAIKYWNNAFGAMLVVFANSFYEVCQKHDVSYSNVKEAVAGVLPHVPNAYLEVNDKWRGYAGVCWTKDVPALNKMAEGTKVEFFRHIMEENDKYKKTTPRGMRKK